MSPPSSGQLREAGGRAKEVRLSMSPTTEVKEQDVSIISFFLKNQVEKILEICEQQTLKTCFCLLTRERRMKKRGSWASAISLN